MTEIEDIVKCTECNSRDLHLDNDKGELYCVTCGLVLEDEMAEDTSSGKEKANDPESPASHSPNKQGYILGSHVGIRNVDGTIDRSKLGRSLRKWDKRTKLTSQEKNRLKGIVLTNMIMAEFGVTNTLKEQAIWNYKKLHSSGMMSGMNLEVRSASVTYFTFRDNGISRTIDEVCKKNSAHPRQVARAARKFARFFKKPWILSQRDITQEVEKYCSLLGVHRTFTASAIILSEILHNVAEQKFITTNAGFLAACLYVTGRLLPNISYRTQVEIATVCNITEVTLRNNMIILLDSINLKRSALEGLTFDEFIAGARTVCPKEE